MTGSGEMLRRRQLRGYLAYATFLVPILRALFSRWLHTDAWGVAALFATGIVIAVASLLLIRARMTRSVQRPALLQPHIYLAVSAALGRRTEARERPGCAPPTGTGGLRRASD